MSESSLGSSVDSRQLSILDIASDEALLSLPVVEEEEEESKARGGAAGGGSGDDAVCLRAGIGGEMMLQAGRSLDQ